MPGIIGSLFARTVLMVTTLTSAIALSSRSVLQAAWILPIPPTSRRWPSSSASRRTRPGGLVDVLGEDGIVPATDRVFGALDTAVTCGRDWIAQQGPKGN